MIPPSSVLVGVDFSESSRAALDFSVRLARHCDATLHVAHLEDPLLLAAAREQGVNTTPETEVELRRFVAEAGSTGDVRYHVGDGPAADGLIRVAGDSHSDLIVVGAHGMSGPARLVFGSTTEGLLRRATCSVLIVPDGWAAPRPDTQDLTSVGPVICGVDLSLPGIDAARAAARLAARLHTAVHLLHVVPQLGVLERWEARADEALQFQLRQIKSELERATAAIGATAPLTLEIEIGRVPERLADAAAKHPHGLLVMGRVLRSHGASPPGSNASRVLGLTTMPVLMHVTRE
jgi:nucleotide-binding universal stress UspA family protein